MTKHYVTDVIGTAIGSVERVSTVWSRLDILQTIRVRWSIGRMNYLVTPGVYAVGKPDADSNIFISANFKLSFDHLRRALHGINAWILVLDTKGINVWCAAGKGTFGTKELVHRISEHHISQLVNHKKLILPQLGAVGVSAFEVKDQTGFKVIYGPVEARDIKPFVGTGMEATPAMRKINFTMIDRLKLIPVELSYGRYYLLLIPAIFFILSGLNIHGYSVDAAWQIGGISVLYLLVAYLSGCVITPMLLPWIPFRRFSVKGLIIGWILGGVVLYLTGSLLTIFEIISWLLMMGSLSSFLAMNFTGSSTFTSLSGVQKEMKLSLPLQIIATGIGIIGWIITRFI